MFDMTNKQAEQDCILPVGKNLSTLKAIVRAAGGFPDQGTLEAFALALKAKGEDWQSQGFAPAEADPLNHILKRISACPTDLWPSADVNRR